MISRRFFCTSKTIINYDLPICAQCKNFIPYVSLDKEAAMNFGKCNLFGIKNIVDGSIKNDYAESARLSKNKCGVKGKYFEGTLEGKPTNSS